MIRNFSRAKVMKGSNKLRGCASERSNVLDLTIIQLTFPIKLWHTPSPVVINASGDTIPSFVILKNKQFCLYCDVVLKA